MSAVVHRPMVEGDLALIYSSWLSGFRNSHFAGLMDDKVYFAVYHDILESLLKKDTVDVWVAAFRPDPDDIFGYIVVDRGYVRPCVHWAHTKEGPGYRRKGVFRSLLAKAGIEPDGEWFYTFRNATAVKLNAPNGFCPRAVHEPRLIRRKSWNGTRALYRFADRRRSRPTIEVTR